MIADEGGGLQFSQGQSLTVEAWVSVEEMGEGANRYIIGKGRTGAEGFGKENQNWALRLRGESGEARLSFLFATPPEAGGDVWHRWTSAAGIRPRDGWHHVAVSYRFGEPASLRAWIDGAPTGGSWDMGGATDKAPVVDGDAVWIGSALGGAPGNSFIGALDEIAVHRGLTGDEDMAARFRREGPPRVIAAERPPELGEIESGVVQLWAHEGAVSHDRWPRGAPGEAVALLRLPDFYLHRLPHRYDDWGIRESWAAPVHLRMAAEVPLPAGRHELLLRTRGLSRVWIDGVQAVETKPHGGSSDGHGPVLPLPEPPAPGMSRVRYGDREHRAPLELGEARSVRVVLESLVGGKKLRADPGEMLLAIRLEHEVGFRLLAPSAPGGAAIDPSSMEARRARSEAALRAADARARREAAASMDAFWDDRHRRGRAAAEEHRIAHAGVDGFLAGKLDAARAAATGGDAAGAAAFHGAVLPVLSRHCLRCHGEKEKGGLRLDSRAGALEVIDLADPAASEFLLRLATDDPDERMPPSGARLSAEELATLEEWVGSGAAWPPAPLPAMAEGEPVRLDDAAFARRAFLDTVGVPPSEPELRAFLESDSADKRSELIDRLLADPRLADGWLPFWQDLLAENPNILKPSLNNSGPFRWFLHEALRDGKPLDRIVTELILLRGSEREGGSAGFGFAADNDSPFAEKGHVIASAFLGVEMQCARCHDAPYHESTQRDLYALAAMLAREPLSVPESSTVPAAVFAGREGRPPLIAVTLPPGEPVAPQWPFGDLVDADSATRWATDPGDPRARLAALVTSPENRRFAEVSVNHIWRRLIGTGIVEPAHDWESGRPSHPELLAWLADELIASGYDTRHVIRLVMTSDLYSRAGGGRNREASPEARLFVAPDRRRMSAEQVVDSLYAASGRTMEVEELTFDPDGRRPATTMISLGKPLRAWEFASLSNERDRPSLALPRAQAVSDVLQAFGWSPSRAAPVHRREQAPDVLQPGVLANSTLSSWVSQAADGSDLADLAVHAQSPEALVESLYLRFLGRRPEPGERSTAVNVLADGFGERLVPDAEIVRPIPPDPLRRVSWTNHLNKEANAIKLVAEQRARAGDPGDPRLRVGWRERYEDLIWALINSPEFVWLP